MSSEPSRYASVLRDGLFDGQTVIVTGGGSGIGRCIAHELAALGAHTVLLGRKMAKLDSVADEIRADGGEVSAYSLDIRKEEAVTETVAQIVADRGVIHGLVNNAGGQYPSPAAAIKKKGFDAVVETNVTGGF